MGRTKDLFQKIRDFKGTIHAKVSTKWTETVWA